MSKPDWRSSSCRPAAAVRISRIDAYIQGSSKPQVSPIDSFYCKRTDLLKAAQPTALAAQPVIGPLLLVGFVSATENFFRDVLAGVVSIRPLARSVAAQEKISLGTVLWHAGRLAERGAFEHMSFTSAENVRTTAKKYAAFEIKKNGPLDAALVEYEKISELRHGVVHSGGVVAGKNALKLELGQATPQSTIGLGFAELQECAEVCSTVVGAANAELFAELVTRWATHWRRHGTWDKKDATARFRTLWALFHSDVDAQNGEGMQQLTRRRCLNLVRREFKI